MLVLAITLPAMLLAQQGIGSSSGKPFNKRTRTEIAADNMYDCHTGFLYRKGFGTDTPERTIMRWDKAARAHCMRQIRTYRRLVGRAQAEFEWKTDWNDVTSRD